MSPNPSISVKPRTQTVRRLIVALACALTCTGVLAAAPAIKTLGFDDMSCRAWTQGKDDVDVRARHIAWARGFLSGHNYARQSQQVSEVSNGTVEIFVTRFCNEKPREDFSTAAQRMSDQYSGRNAAITK